MDQELKDDLLAIVSQPEWNEAELLDWAEDFLEQEGDDRGTADYLAEQHARQFAKLDELKAQVRPARFPEEDRAVPLPQEPDGMVHGIGFIYDEDRDSRVLLAIDQLKDFKWVLAVSEHEGCLTIYSFVPTCLQEMIVADDVWSIKEFVAFRGKWVLADRAFVEKLLKKGLGMHVSDERHEMS